MGFLVAMAIVIFAVLCALILYSCICIARDIDDIARYDEEVIADVHDKETGGSEREH